MSIPWRERLTVKKDPDAKLVYAFDWSDWLAAGAALDSHTITIDGPDADLTYDTDAIDGETVEFRLLGGTAGEEYTVTCHIATDETPVQEDDRSITVKITEH